MPSIKTIVKIFCGIILMGLLSFAFHLFGTQNKFKIENLPYNEIKLVEVNDRGLIGDKTLSFSAPNTIEEFKTILKKSKEVQWDDIKIKSNNGLCEIVLHTENNSTITLTLCNTSYNGGIIISEDYYYRNDMLLNFIMERLKADK